VHDRPINFSFYITIFARLAHGPWTEIQRSNKDQIKDVDQTFNTDFINRFVDEIGGVGESLRGWAVN